MQQHSRYLLVVTTACATRWAEIKSDGWGDDFGLASAATATVRLRRDLRDGVVLRFGRHKMSPRACSDPEHQRRSGQDPTPDPACDPAPSTSASACSPAFRCAGLPRGDARASLQSADEHGAWLHARLRADDRARRRSRAVAQIAYGRFRSPDYETRRNSSPPPARSPHAAAAGHERARRPDVLPATPNPPAVAGGDLRHASATRSRAPWTSPRRSRRKASRRSRSTLSGTAADRSARSQSRGGAADCRRSRRRPRIDQDGNVAIDGTEAQRRAAANVIGSATGCARQSRPHAAGASSSRRRRRRRRQRRP